LLHRDIGVSAAGLRAEAYSAMDRVSKVRETKDVVPPWVYAKGSEFWSGVWRQGGHESWILDCWYPYIKSLSREEQDAYFDRWKAPEDWRLWFMDNRDRKSP